MVTKVMEHPVQIHTIQKIGSELAIAWGDGQETFFSCEFLRRHCPCAVCGGEPDVMGEVDAPTVQYGPGSFELMAWDFVGGYALQPIWGDGHRSGLYSFRYLRRLASQLNAS